jgi:cation:H+ antiporter
MVVFALTAPLTALDGVALLALFAVFLGYVAVRESKRDTPVFRDAELYEAYSVAGGSGGAMPVLQKTRPPELAADLRRRPAWTRLGLAVVALAGLVVGSAVTGVGTKGILQTYGLQGTVFGATIATAVLTVEDVFLTVEPARKGAPEIGVGNVIGSVVFSVTGKLGIVLLAGSVVIDRSVLTWHLPALLVVNGLAAYFLSTGQLRRWHGFALLALYAAYWIMSFTAFGTAPVDTS